MARFATKICGIALREYRRALITVKLNAVLPRTLILSILFFSGSLALAAPAPKAARKAPAKYISIDPAAKVVLERVAKLYGATSKWKGVVVEPSSPRDFVQRTRQFEIAYARPDKVRIEFRVRNTPIIDLSVGKDIKPTLEVSNAGDLGRELSYYLKGKTGLAEARWQISRRNGISLSVKRLPDVRWKNMTCQRVVVEKHFKPTEDEPVEMEKCESWFTPQGKWVKNIRSVKTKSFDPDFSFDDPDVVTSEFRSQNFAPVFGPKTWVQPPEPKNPFEN